jgi:hypothetical protein
MQRLSTSNHAHLRYPTMFAIAFALTFAALVPRAVAQSFDAATLTLLHDLQRQPNELARYAYLIDVAPKLPPAARNVARQYASFTQDELGIYDEAVLGFPLQSREPTDLQLPAADGWSGRNAVDVVTALAADRRIVLVNEAHHDARSRQLTLALLPRLRKLGFTHFAAEALGDDDPQLAQRGYPIAGSGTEYLREPLYGDIVREALRLGFILVPYDGGTGSAQQREAAQAEALYRQVLAGHPEARLFVHAGYAHIDKAPGRLIQLQPMAARLRALSGLEPLSIDQTDITEVGFDDADIYHQLIAHFPTKQPEILVDRSGKPWSARPALYDANVILPPSLNVAAFGDQHTFGSALGPHTNAVVDTARFSLAWPDLVYMQRPSWLTLNGQRRPYDISTALCRSATPCVVEAHYVGEPDDASAADRYAFTKSSEATRLFLRPGRYRLRAWDLNGRTLSERQIEIAQP